MKPRSTLGISFLLAILASLSTKTLLAADPQLQLNKGDHISYIGNTLADRMQHHGWLETYIHALFPEQDLVFRNLAVPGDELKVRPREENFGDPHQWLAKNETDVVFCFFGYNESFRGQAGLDNFRSDLAETIADMRGQKYNGTSAPKLVFFSPIAHENLNSPHLPDGAENNSRLEIYTEAMREVCRENDVTMVDLFTPSLRLYASAEEPLTMNGIHLLDHGNRALADVIVRELFGVSEIDRSEEDISKLRDAVLDKNYHWFSRYRVVDGYNVFGGRSKLAWFGQSNADVMMREMEIFDRMTANRDEGIQAVARGGEYDVIDDNLPEEVAVPTNKPGPLEDGRHPYLGGEEAIEKMTVHQGMEVNLFASEEMFPRLINPVQMAVDTDSRLWVSVWPSYPHWNPTETPRDALLILPDEDRDGVADECVVFADGLNSITGFEFWGGGVLVSAPPEIWFLKDTDGDNRADVKVRMLQGVSSADTHHSANAMLVGPDGWLYWSRGIFNVANFETPTGTFRSEKSGVYRFNPRTFEMEFHFPIGPNPHGDVFDRWGYQFASDGTSGTGSYINIGKGLGNKQWYEKRVRPVAATGILSGSHFPPEHEGNFLICNTIGFLGVLQHEVTYDGADIVAKEIEPIVYSSDENFRPSDVEIGGDGALYISDWHNVLIGHMQHNMRDPNRDHEHGRIYRVTYNGRPLAEPVKLQGEPIDRVCDAFYAQGNAIRYRARLELTGRDSQEVVRQVAQWASRRDVSRPEDAQALLECLWVFEEQRVVNVELLKTVFRAEEPRVRAAAIRTLGHWASRIDQGEAVLLSAARDDSALVRSEALKAAVEFEGPAAAEVVFEVASRSLDPELETVLKFAKSRIPADKLLHEAIRAGRPLSQATLAYALQNADVSDLLELEPAEVVYEAVLGRQDAPQGALREALAGLAELRQTTTLLLLLDLIDRRDAAGRTEALRGLSPLFAEQPQSQLQELRDRIVHLALNGTQDATRQLAFAALVHTDGAGNGAVFAASEAKQSLRDLLAAIPLIQDDELRGSLYHDVRSLMFELPPNLEQEQSAGEPQQSGIRVDYFHPNPSDVASQTLAKLQPQAGGIVPEIVMDVPQREKEDAFALRFTGLISVPKSGKYTFYTASDDGSRLYIDGQQIVNNDGLHGMSEKAGTVQMNAGLHEIIVTYFDNGGGDGLAVSWAGPEFDKQSISAERLTVSGGEETIHDAAIRALAFIPGHEAEKFVDLTRLIRSGRHQTSAIDALKAIPEEHWPEQGLRGVVDNVIGYLSSLPPRLRTGGTALDATALARSLAKKLPEAEAGAIEQRLQNLDVRVIAIGAVPERMIYDKERIVVQAGKPVEFRFSNADNMPHNFAIVEPGALEEIGLLAEATARDPDAKERHYIPSSDRILLASQLLETGESQALSFDAPSTPGVYPYVCTYPGHWRRMFGALYVVADLDEYLAAPEEYLAANPLPLEDELLKFTSRNTEWELGDLGAAVTQIQHGRSFEVGRTLFNAANCVACHRLNEEGRELGPDLTKIDAEKQTMEHLLRSILEPSADIAEQYQSYSFLLDSGKIVTGQVVEETSTAVQVLVDPLAKADPTVIEKDAIEERVKSPLSIMPSGLLNKFTEEEILDLLAYVFAKGDKEHMLFRSHHHH